MDVEFTKNFTHTMIDFINVIEHPTISISIRFKLNQLKKKKEISTKPIYANSFPILFVSSKKKERWFNISK